MCIEVEASGGQTWDEGCIKYGVSALLLGRLTGSSDLLPAIVSGLWLLLPK
jgi:hypothetical protein